MINAFDVNENLYSFHRVSDFLQAFYRHKKLQNPKWSYEAWAKKLKQSKSTLIRNVKGTLPLNENMVKAYEKFFGFNQDAKKYFSAIVAYETIKRSYPNLPIQILEIAHLRKGKFPLRIPDLTPDQDGEFLSRVDVWWLTTLVGSAGIEYSKLNELQDYFHPGLGHINMKTLAEECLRRGLLKREGGRIRFDSESVNYLGLTVTGLDTTVRRYKKIFHALNAMLEADHSQKKIAFENRACSLKCDIENFPFLVQKTQAYVKELMSEFHDDAGNMVLDLQVFLTPVVKPAGRQIPLAQKSETN